MAFACPIEAKPYLHLTPPELRVGPFASLLKLLGARLQFLPADYAQLLGDMAAEHEEKGLAEPAQLVARELSPSTLDLALHITQYLSDHAYTLRTALYIPSQNRTLCLAPTLVFDDAPWLSETTKTPSDSDKVKLDSKRQRQRRRGVACFHADKSVVV